MAEEQQDKTIVLIGNIHEGWQFFGPFDDEKAAQHYIQTMVHMDLDTDWAYLQAPDGFEPEACAMCGSLTQCDCEDKIVRLPENDKPLKVKTREVVASTVILNEKGKVIGEQLIVPGA